MTTSFVMQPFMTIVQYNIGCELSKRLFDGCGRWDNSLNVKNSMHEFDNWQKTKLKEVSMK